MLHTVEEIAKRMPLKHDGMPIKSKCHWPFVRYGKKCGKLDFGKMFSAFQRDKLFSCSENSHSLPHTERCLTLAELYRLWVNRVSYAPRVNATDLLENGQMFIVFHLKYVCENISRVTISRKVRGMQCDFEFIQLVFEIVYNPHLYLDCRMA